MSKKKAQQPYYDWHADECADNVLQFIDPTQIIDFLQKIRPGGPWLLVSIHPDTEAIKAETFIGPGDAEILLIWVKQQQNEFCNIYFSVALPKRAMSKKTAKTDLASTRYAWAEIDLPAGLDVASLQAEKTKVLERLRAFPIKPAVITDSGNGLHVFFRLDCPFSLRSPLDRAAFEAVNRALACALGADLAGHNCDRILRVPGTANFPNAKKRSKGRKPALARFIEFDAECECSFEELSKAVTPWIKKVGEGKATADEMQGWQDIDQEELRRHAPEDIRADIAREIGVNTGEHSGHFWNVVRAILERCRKGKHLYGLKEARALIDNQPCAAKWTADGPDAVDKDVLRIYGKWIAEGRPGVEEKAEPEEDFDGPKLTIDFPEFEWKDPTTLPVEPFIYGAHYCRGEVSATVAAGGVGKSRLTIVECLAIASFRNLVGIMPDEQCNVAIWDEDSRSRLDKCVTAAMLIHGILPHEIKGRFFIESGKNTPICIARQTKSGTVIREPVKAAVKEFIRARGIGVLVINPFVSCHDVQENDNGAIDKVMNAWGEIAAETNCAIELVHHIRKAGGGTEVTADDARGGSAFKNNVRSLRLGNPMSPAEARQAGIEEDRRLFYFKVTNGKRNFAPPSSKADWFELVDVNLGNGDKIGTGAVRVWKWPKIEADLPEDALKRVQQHISEGEWRESVQSKARWAGNAVATALGWDLEKPGVKDEIKKLLKGWIKDDYLRVEDAPDKNGVQRPNVVVGRVAWT